MIFNLAATRKSYYETSHLSQATARPALITAPRPPLQRSNHPSHPPPILQPPPRPSPARLLLLRNPSHCPTAPPISPRPSLPPQNPSHPSPRPPSPPHLIPSHNPTLQATPTISTPDPSPPGRVFPTAATRADMVSSSTGYPAVLVGFGGEENAGGWRRGHAGGDARR